MVCIRGYLEDVGAILAGHPAQWSDRDSRRSGDGVAGSSPSGIGKYALQSRSSGIRIECGLGCGCCMGADTGGAESGAPLVESEIGEVAMEREESRSGR